MVKKPLPIETAAKTGFTHLVILTRADLTQATVNTAQVIPILDVVPGDIIGDLATVLKTPYQDISDAAFNTTTVTIGDGNSAARFLASQELNLNGTEVLYKTQAHTSPFVYTVPDTVDITFTPMAAKALVDLDAGELHIYVSVTRLAALEAMI